MLRKPKNLQKGDKIVILSTARKIAYDEIATAKTIFENWGLEVVLGKTIGEEENQFAGNDELRTQDLQFYLNDKETKAIICARGGYGTIRILNQLDFTQFTSHPKWLVGYSDITVLHTHINNYLGIETIHGTMPINFPNNTEEAIGTLKKVLFGEPHVIEFDGSTINKGGAVRGEIIGGNLSILYSLLGTDSGFNADNKILFIEDLDEYLYHIDRMMIALKRAGKLNKIKALLVGGMTDMKDNAIAFGKTAEEIILEHTKEYNYPICFNVPVGHIKDNRAIIFGREAALNISIENCKISF